MRYAPVVTHTPWYQRPILMGVLLVGMLFSAGAYVQHKNQVRAKELAQIELEKRKLEEQEAQRKLEEDARREAMVARLNADAKANDAQVRYESAMAGRNVEASNAAAAAQLRQQAYSDRAEAMRKEATERNAKLQVQMDAQRNTLTDQQRIRNLCLQNYGRPNC